MLWLYRIASTWTFGIVSDPGNHEITNDDKIGEADVYFFNLEEERDINDESYWLCIKSIEYDIEDTKFMIDSCKKDLKKGKEKYEMESILLNKDSDIKKRKKIEIDTRESLKYYEEELAEYQNYYDGLEDNYDINEDNFVMYVRNKFNKHELLEWIKIFIEEVFGDNNVGLVEGAEADFAGTNQDSVGEMIANARMKEIKESGILDRLNKDE